MIYTIVNIIKLENNEIKYTPIGYITSEIDINSINSNYENTLGEFIKNNLTNLSNGTILLSEFFNTTPTTYSAYQQTTNIDDMNLNLITDINTLK